jgi:ligand-binding SRPBCC domain-containing protein
VLRHKITITAPLQDVWNTFTTTEGLNSCIAPVASIDLKVGAYWKQVTTGMQYMVIMAFLPMEMLSIRIVQTPPDFPNPELETCL